MVKFSGVLRSVTVRRRRIATTTFSLGEQFLRKKGGTGHSQPCVAAMHWYWTRAAQAGSQL